MPLQQSKDRADLARWQELRNAGLEPEERLEILCRDFFSPPIALDCQYEAQLRDVREEMSHG